MVGGFNYIDIIINEPIGESLDDALELDYETFKKIKSFYNDNDKPLIVNLKYDSDFAEIKSIFICNKIDLKASEMHARFYFGGLGGSFTQYIVLIIDDNRAGIFGSISL